MAGGSRGESGVGGALETEVFAALAAGVVLVAALYSSVGHAGASGYLAVMALAGLAPAEMRPIALVLNVVVASIASWQFWRAGHFRWSLFWPFALLSIPCAYLGGRVELPPRIFEVLIGAILLLSAARFLARPADDGAGPPPPRSVSLPAGALLGLLSGLTGTGGGIFLTPLLLLMRWATAKQAAAVSALFILANSVAGLLGSVAGGAGIPPSAAGLAVAAAAGGATGSHLGSRRLPAAAIRRLLAVVLIVAGGKLVLP